MACIRSPSGGGKDAPKLTRPQGGIGRHARVALPLSLPAPRLGDASADDCRAVPGKGRLEVLGIDGGKLHVKVDPVEERP